MRRWHLFFLGRSWLGRAQRTAGAERDGGSRGGLPRPRISDSPHAPRLEHQGAGIGPSGRSFGFGRRACTGGRWLSHGCGSRLIAHIYQRRWKCCRSITVLQCLHVPGDGDVQFVGFFHRQFKAFGEVALSTLKYVTDDRDW
ncbi:hypothetical protein Mapa_005797 [Marchantia paleacea]|nr:hypothetical protein Mapa_005797 [Marchantia paleacea]